MSSELGWIAGRRTRTGARSSSAEESSLPGARMPNARGSAQARYAARRPTAGSAAARHAIARLEQFEHPTLDRRARLPGMIGQVVEIHDLSFGVAPQDARVNVRLACNGGRVAKRLGHGA